jgi:hypothetical protein
MAPPEGSPSQQRFQHSGRMPSQKRTSEDNNENHQGQKTQGKERDDRAMLRKISMLKAENRKLVEELDLANSENAKLETYGGDLRKKLESTRSALKDSRDSLEKVQLTIKPLMQNQRTRDEQHQQLIQLNRVYEKKLRECEERLQIAEMNSLRQEQKEERPSASDDNVLIEKLHERLLSSQNLLIKAQSELQRSHIEKAAVSSELAECQRKISGQEVQILMASQSHTQQQQAKEEEDWRNVWL